MWSLVVKKGVRFDFLVLLNKCIFNFFNYRNKRKCSYFLKFCEEKIVYIYKEISVRYEGIVYLFLFLFIIEVL